MTAMTPYPGMNASETDGQTEGKIKFVRHQSITQDSQRKTLITIQREFQDRTKKMRVDLLSMRAAAVLPATMVTKTSQNTPGQAAQDSDKSDDK